MIPCRRWLWSWSHPPWDWYRRIGIDTDELGAWESSKEVLDFLLVNLDASGPILIDAHSLSLMTRVIRCKHGSGAIPSVGGIIRVQIGSWIGSWEMGHLCASIFGCFADSSTVGKWVRRSSSSGCVDPKIWQCLLNGSWRLRVPSWSLALPLQETNSKITILLCKWTFGMSARFRLNVW
jgi:hypothetical protein